MTREPKQVHPWAHKMPGYRFIPVNQLTADHPAIKFLHKDYLFDLDRYYVDYGMVYCPADSGLKLYDKPYTTSAERLIFPVKFKGDMVGWQMRSIPDTFYGDRADVIKYIHLFEKGDYLFNYDEARKCEMIVVTEGVKKALKFPNGVATFGKGISDNQLQLIQSWKKITMMLDGEDGTQKLAMELTEAIRLNGRQVVNIDLRRYGFSSPDEAPADQLASIVYREWNK